MRHIINLQEHSSSLLEVSDITYEGLLRMMHQ